VAALGFNNTQQIEMIAFYNQSWFWAGFFTAIASLGGILIKEWISTRSQVKLERLKIYESDIFKAYNQLYQFTSNAYEWLWPPSDPAQEFSELMKSSSFKGVKENMLFYNSEIREVLEKFESQNTCLRDPDLIPEKSFDDFYRDDLLNLLRKLENDVKCRTDNILHEK
jgi:hypothetical protein